MELLKQWTTIGWDAWVYPAGLVCSVMMDFDAVSFELLEYWICIFIGAYYINIKIKIKIKNSHGFIHLVYGFKSFKSKLFELLFFWI